jgi:hypothetical protein
MSVVLNREAIVCSRGQRTGTVAELTRENSGLPESVIVIEFVVTKVSAADDACWRLAGD